MDREEECHGDGIENIFNKNHRRNCSKVRKRNAHLGTRHIVVKTIEMKSKEGVLKASRETSQLTL